jgi:predicted signal transduction protein with EAL and GGDEF domain
MCHRRGAVLTCGAWQHHSLACNLRGICWHRRQHKSPAPTAAAAVLPQVPPHYSLVNQTINMN